MILSVKLSAEKVVTVRSLSHKNWQQRNNSPLNRKSVSTESFSPAPSNVGISSNVFMMLVFSGLLFVTSFARNSPTVFVIYQLQHLLSFWKCCRCREACK